MCKENTKIWNKTELILLSIGRKWDKNLGWITIGNK